MSGLVVVPFEVATVVRDACTADRRRPNRRAGLAARPAAATSSGRRRRFGRRRRSRVRKPCATETRVTWWCQPTQPRPWKWSSPRAPFQLPVILLHSPARPGQPHQLHDRSRLGQVRQPILGRLGLAAGHSTAASAPAARRRPGVPAGVGDPGRAHPQRQEAAALQPLGPAPPDQLHASLLPSLEGELGQRAWAVAVARPPTAALARVRRSGGVDLR
jgi:hypothetical protein